VNAAPELLEPVMCGHLWFVPAFGGAARGAVEDPAGGAEGVAGAAVEVAAGVDVVAAAEVPSTVAPIAPPASVPSAAAVITPLRSLPMQWSFRSFA
jgi:hypothetical protein